MWLVYISKLVCYTFTCVSQYSAELFISTDHSMNMYVCTYHGRRFVKSTGLLRACPTISPANLFLLTEPSKYKLVKCVCTLSEDLHYCALISNNHGNFFFFYGFHTQRPEFPKKNENYITILSPRN